MMRAMRMVAAAIVGMAIAAGARAPVAQSGSSAAREHGRLRLSYVQKPIGLETYEITRAAGGVLELKSDFDFTDRGGRVQLTATLHTARDLTPLQFRATGKSYRFVNVDSEITINGRDALVRADGATERVTVPQTFFTVDGYAPFAAQMLLVRYWRQHGRPAVLQTVPGRPLNDVIIEHRGRETISFGSQPLVLDRYAIDGVVWG